MVLLTKILNSAISYEVGRLRRASFGKGNSAELFLETMLGKDIWEINHQKQFREL
ncbi:MAG: hypothetical protein PHW92_11275 [Lutibacter sp.]|nr:hypothetical protein [Lutibacter sp.]